MAEVFNTQEADETYTVSVGNSNYESEGEIEAQEVSELAEQEGVGKFQVVTQDGGNGLNSEDFPVSEDIRVLEYNENA